MIILSCCVPEVLTSQTLSINVSVSTDPTIRMSSATALLTGTVSFWHSCTLLSEYSSLRNTGLLISTLRSVTGITNDGDFSSDVGLTRGFFRAVLLRAGSWGGEAFFPLGCGVVSSIATRLLTNPAEVVCVVGGDVFVVVVWWWWFGGDLWCDGGGDVLLVVL